MTQPKLTDQCFDIRYEQGVHAAEFTQDAPEDLCDYVNSYLSKVSKYRNMTPERPYATYSLYQPPLATAAGKRSLLMRLRRKYERVRIPATVTVGTTKHCQCVCQHCSADYHMASFRPQLPLKTLLAGVQEAVELGVTNIILVGGEPLLHKGVFDLIAGIDSDKANVVMFSNGELLTPANCRKLKDAGLFGLYVSLDDVDGTKHNAARARPGLFAKACQGVRNANEAGLVAGISSYLTHEKLVAGDFESMMELGRELGAREITFFDAIAVGRNDDNNKQHTFLTSQDRLDIDRLTRLYRKRPEYPALSPQSVLTSAEGSGFCFAANTQFYLSATGEVTPCDFTPLTAGRYPDQSIAELWRLLTDNDIYRKRSAVCRMQDPEFRNQTINRIPINAERPYPIASLLAQD